MTTMTTSTTSAMVNELSIEDVLSEQGSALPQRSLMRHCKHHHFVNTIHPIINHPSHGSNVNNTTQINNGGGSNFNNTVQTNHGGGSNFNNTVQVNNGGGSNFNNTVQTNG
jgi:hypothetical protein